MAWYDHIRITHPPYMREYTHTIWGEIIDGTKEQLQALGIGVGIQFPVSERQKVRVTDPRGFEATIYSNSYRGDGIYSARIIFPGRDMCFGRDSKWEPFAPGVELREATGSDEYIGSAEALSAAGLVQIADLPGQPGRGKVQVTLYADGTMRTTRNGHEKHTCGMKRIKRVSKTCYSVEVRIPVEEGELRKDAYLRLEAAWEERMAALPRPAPLIPLDLGDVLTRRVRHAKQDKSFQHFLSGLIQ